MDQAGMDQANLLLIGAGAALAGIAMIAAAGLRAWNGWLELRRLEVGQADSPGIPGTAARIELADLRERVRKLEAIAAGIDP